MVADTLSGDSLVLMSSCSPLLKVDSTCNLLQTNRKWWMRQDVTPMIMLWLWLCCVTQESISTADPLQRVSSLASWKGWPLLLLSRFSRVRPLATPWTEAYQAHGPTWSAYLVHGIFQARVLEWSASGLQCQWPFKCWVQCLGSPTRRLCCLPQFPSAPYTKR